MAQGIRIGGIGLDGPLSYGMIDFYNSDGSLCEVTATDENSFYEIIISPSCTFPLKVVMTEGVDASTNLTNPTTLYSLVVDQNVSTINVNTYTTLIYYAALARTTDGSLKSLSSENVNLDAITYEITRKFNFGIDAEDRDFNPLESTVTEDNVVSFVKANEGLMEGVRRVARAASGDGEATAAAIDQVLSALGSDISDGLLDGRINNLGSRTYETLGLSGAQLVGIWEANALDVSLELMTNRLSISLTKEQKAYQAQAHGIPLESVAGDIGADQVAHNLATAIGDMVYNLGGFITEEEAIQRLEQIGITRKFLNQTQAALEFQLVVASATGLDTDSLNSLRETLTTLAGLMDSTGGSGLCFDQIRGYLDGTSAGMVTASIKNGNVDSNTIENAISEARLEINTSESLPQNSRKLVATWDYGGTPPEKFRLYETCNKVTKIVCEVPGHLTTSEPVDCYSDMNEVPKEFYLTAYAGGIESAPSPRISYGNKMPRAIFHASFTAGQLPLTVDLDAVSSYDPDGLLSQFRWDFGDGAQASGANVSHTFQNQGTYNILLKVWDDYAASAMAVLSITVGEEKNTLGDPVGFIGTIRTLDSVQFDPAPVFNALPAIKTSATSASPRKEEGIPRVALNIPQEELNRDRQDELKISSKEPEPEKADKSEADWRSPVHAFLIEWLAAWEKTAGKNGNVLSYGEMYSERFKSGKFDKESWIKDKARKNSGKEWIKLGVKDIEITRSDKGLIKVRFTQEYSSSNFSDKSQKELLLTEEGGRLQILNETTL